MSAPERVRAYLTARTEFYKETGQVPAYIAETFHWEGNGGEQFRLTEADLEACLQTIDILARLVSGHADSTPEFVLRAAEFAIHIKEDPEHDER